MERGGGQNRDGDTCVCTCWPQCGQSSRWWGHLRALCSPVRQDENQEHDDFPNWLRGHRSRLTPVNPAPEDSPSRSFRVRRRLHLSTHAGQRSAWAALDTPGDKDAGTRSLFGEWRQGKVVGKWEEEEKASMVLLWLLSSFPPLGRPHCRMPPLSSRNQSTREPGSQRSSSHDPAWVLLGMLSFTLQADPRRSNGLQQQQTSPGTQMLTCGSVRRPGQGALAARVLWTERQPPVVLIRPGIAEPSCGEVPSEVPSRVPVIVL